MPRRTENKESPASAGGRITGLYYRRENLLGEDVPKPEQRVDNVVELVPNDPELDRAWKSFPDPVADNHGFCWEYMATELIGDQWVHVFVHELHPVEYRTVYARVPARPGWDP